MTARDMTASEMFDRLARLYRHLAVGVACPVCDAPVMVDCDTGADAPHLPRVAAAEFGEAHDA